MARNPKAYVRLRGRNFDFRLYLGNGRPRPTGGGAEYEGQSRPQADMATIFTGNGLLTVDVPVLLDGWGPPGERRDVGPTLDRIYNLCFGRKRKPPPDFLATYPGPGSGGRFQMSLPEELEDPEPIVGPNGSVFRQALILKLIEYNDPAGVDFIRRGPVGSKAKEADLTSIVLSQPMTLLQVAAKYLNGPDDAQVLGELNDIKDLRKKLPAGTRVKLGTAANLNYAVEAN